MQTKQPHYLALWGWGTATACTDHDGNAAVRMTSSCWTYEGYSLPLTKPTLRAMVDNGTISVFHEASVCLSPPPSISVISVHAAAYLSLDRKFYTEVTGKGWRQSQSVAFKFAAHDMKRTHANE